MFTAFDASADTVIATKTMKFMYNIQTSNYDMANSFLMFAIASAGFRFFGHVREQLRIVWHRYTLMELLSASRRSAFFSSRESASHR
jgi:hypothetical protein